MNIRSIGLFLVLFFLSLITILPLFHAGFFPIHDSTQVARVYEMKKALVDGFFPVRMVKDLGYGFGYPIFNFYAPLSYYLGGLFALGLSSLLATKIMIGIGMVLAGITMYVLARLFVKTEGALLSSVLYVFAPYHAVNLYVRGAVAELFAYAFLPLAFYGLVRLFRKGDGMSVIVAGLSLAAVILSHNLTALMLVPFYGALTLYYIFKSKPHRKKLLFVLAGFLGLTLSAFYWLPALFETKYTSVATLTTGGSQYKDHFVCLVQLWSSQWGFGGSAPGCLDGLSFQIGKLHILLGVLCIVAVFLGRAKNVLIFSLIGAAFSVFMLLPDSRPLWDSLPPLSYLQFPWRYLQFVSFFLSLTGGIGLYTVLEHFMPGKKHDLIRLGGALLIVFAVVALYTKNFKPQHFITQYPDQTQQRLLTWTVSNISDEYMPMSFVRPSQKSEPPKPIETGGLVRIDVNKTQTLEATISQPTAQTVTINKAYFPAWKIQLTGHEFTPQVKNGIYQLTVPAGTTKLSVNYVSTPIQKIGNLISLLSLLVSFIGIIIWQKKPAVHAKTS